MKKLLQFRYNKIILSIIILVSLFLGFFDFPDTWDSAVDHINWRIENQVKFLSFIKLPNFPSMPFHLGLDLQGGSHLIYQADLSSIESGNEQEAMQGVRDVIERRINMFGITEPVVQITKESRLIVELAGIKDTATAIAMIGETPYLDFRKERSEEARDKILKEQEAQNPEYMYQDPYFEFTALSGQQLQSARLELNQTTYQPIIALEFTDEGKKIFARLTRENIGKRIAIYLDNIPISIPVVQEEIKDGNAVIQGDFTIEEAKELVRRLNAGALPVPINLIAQETIGASLGNISLEKSLFASLIGLLLLAIFLLINYRLPGICAIIALGIYGIIVLAIFKLLSVTLTLSGIAGFILSLGMAVDANILIFERFREELKQGNSLNISITQGFKRAWSSIRDGNISTLITCLVLYIFTTGLIRGFAITLGIGIIISMFSAMIVTRLLLNLFTSKRLEKRKWLFGI